MTALEAAAKAAYDAMDRQVAKDTGKPRCHWELRSPRYRERFTAGIAAGLLELRTPAAEVIAKVSRELRHTTHQQEAELGEGWAAMLDEIVRQATAVWA